MSNGPFETNQPGPRRRDLLNQLWTRQAGGITATSTTSLTVGAGTHVLDVGSDLQFVPGQPIRIASAAEPTSIWMDGTVIEYSGSSLTVAVTDSQGSGTRTDWMVTVTGAPGRRGEGVDDAIAAVDGSLSRSRVALSAEPSVSDRAEAPNENYIPDDEPEAARLVATDRHGHEVRLQGIDTRRRAIVTLIRDDQIGAQRTGSAVSVEGESSVDVSGGRLTFGTGARDLFDVDGRSSRLTMGTGTRDLLVMDGESGNLSEMRTGTSTMVEGDASIDVAGGSLTIGTPVRDTLMIDETGMHIDAPTLAPRRHAGVFRDDSGVLRAVETTDFETGKPQYIGTDQPGVDGYDIMPQALLAAEHPDLSVPLFQGIPACAIVGTRIWASWCRNVTVAAEAATNFIVVGYSDDDGLTWTEYLYIVSGRTGVRVVAQHMWTDPFGRLWVLFGIDRGTGNDGWRGTFVMTIKDPLADTPSRSRMWRMTEYGWPCTPFPLDEMHCVGIEMMPRGNIRLPDHLGKTIYKIDITGRAVDAIGRIPWVATEEHPEISIVQLHDGSLVSISRGDGGQHITRSPTGDPNDWTTPVLWSALGTNPRSRACLRLSPRGNLIVAYNHAGRTDITVAVSLDGGETLAQSVSIDTISGGPQVSYPDVKFDGAGRILIVWDRDRHGTMQIRGAWINESDLLAGTATPTYFYVSNPTE